MKNKFLVVIFLVTSFAVCKAQNDATYDWHDHWMPVWNELRGSFLEPNRFATAFDFKPGWYRIEAGYGGEIARFSSTTIGAEGLIWSGLKAYKDFRFPVQTADYFFGLYSIFPLPLWGTGLDPWKMRFRLSHISSHLVDGAASVEAGASSKFSREFISVETLFDETDARSFRLSLGIRLIIHQISSIEQSFQFPGVLDFVMYKDRSSQVFATLSTDAGPSLANYSGGITYRRTSATNSIADVYAEFHTGRTRYGVEGNVKQDGFEIGIRVATAREIERDK
ncbi:MAG: hypothetical protein WCH46_03355 [bacterium]